MTIRTSSKSVTFRRPFTLRGVDETFPAGAYIVETDEEKVEGISFVAYRRIASHLRLPGRRGSAVVGRMLLVEPGDIDVALRRDQSPVEPENCAAPYARRDPACGAWPGPVHMTEGNSAAAPWSNA